MKASAFTRGCALSFIAAVVSLSACASNQPAQLNEVRLIEAEFPARYMVSMVYAYNDFHSLHPDLSCFVVDVFYDRDTFQVSFVQELNVDPDEIEFTVTTGDSDECDRGVTYHFDASGNFVRRSYQR